MTILNKLQNYRWTTKNIEQAIHFIQTISKSPPPKRSATTYNKNMVKYKDFVVRNGRLFYNPLNLEVVPEDKPAEINAKLEQVYQSGTAIGKGQNQFHQLVLQSYLGIRRKNVIDFLRGKPEYQLNLDKRRIVSKGIQATKPFQYWCIDLVDMNPYDNIRANRKYRYIFSCMDVFSKFCWFIPIKKKEAKDTREAFKKILQYNLKFKPVAERNRFDFVSYVVSDNGSEFKGELEEFFKEHGIIHKTTKSYVPQPNIEAVNGVLRQMMRAQFIRTNSLAWYPYISLFADSKNTNRDAKTGKTPLDIMQNYFANNHPLIQQVADKVKTKNEERFNRFYKQEDFQVGDKVRVKMTSFQSKLRQKEKEGEKKLIVVRFSPDIYQIQSIRQIPEGQFGYPLYYLKDNQNRLIRLKNNSPRPFNSGELIKVNQNTPANHAIDLTRANFLNRNNNGEDLYYEPPAVNEPAPPPPRPVRQPKPIMQWKSKEWNDALRGKLFTDYDNVRSQIIKVEYSRVYRSYIIDYRPIRNATQTFQEELEPILELGRGEDWFIPAYEEWLD